MATLRLFFEARISDWMVGHGTLIPIQKDIPDNVDARPIEFMAGLRKIVVCPAGNGSTTYFDLSGEVEEIIDTFHDQLTSHPRIHCLNRPTDHVSLRANFYSQERRIPGYYEEECGEDSGRRKHEKVKTWLDESEPNHYRVRIAAPDYVMAEIMYNMIREGKVAPKRRWNLAQTPACLGRPLWDLSRESRNS